MFDYLQTSVALVEFEVTGGMIDQLLCCFQEVGYGRN